MRIIFNILDAAVWCIRLSVPTMKCGLSLLNIRLASQKTVLPIHMEAQLHLVPKNAHWPSYSSR